MDMKGKYNFKIVDTITWCNTNMGWKIMDQYGYFIIFYYMLLYFKNQRYNFIFIVYTHSKY